MLEHFDDYVEGRGHLQLKSDNGRVLFGLMHFGSSDEHSVDIMTKTDSEIPTHFVLDSQRSVRAAATLMRAVLEAAGITRVSEAVESAERA